MGKCYHLITYLITHKFAYDTQMYIIWVQSLIFTKMKYSLINKKKEKKNTYKIATQMN